MRILGARIFLSLLAGKFKIFKQILTSENDTKIRKNSACVFFLSLLAGKFDISTAFTMENIYMQTR